jgi:betaine-homocysteine S-methyltransferase
MSRSDPSSRNAGPAGDTTTSSGPAAPTPTPELFREKIAGGETLVLAGGYLFEVERRGYLTAGEFVPKVALEHPEVLRQVTTDFVRAGSDIALAFTYNGHREKMRIVGEEDLLEDLNRAALRIAREVAEEETARSGRPIFTAGNLSNSNIYDPNDPASADEVRAMYREMAGWAAEEGAQLILAETMYFYEEARIALEEIHRAGLPGIINVAVFATGELRDGVAPGEACRSLVDAGADVVGTNCFRGPATISPVLDQIAQAAPDAPKCVMPVAYRTSHEHPTFFNLPDPRNTAELPNGRTFPDALEGQLHNRYEMANFAREAREKGYQIIGICCGGSVVHHRALAEALGRQPYLSAYSPDMSKHFMFGSDPRLKSHITGYKDEA